MYESEVEVRGHRGRPCTKWLEGVKKACKVKLQGLIDAKLMCMIRKQWKEFVYCTNDCLDV